MNEQRCNTCGGEYKLEKGFAGLMWLMCQNCRMSKSVSKHEMDEMLKAAKRQEQDDDD